MNVQERFRQAIDQLQSRLRASVLPDRQAAIFSLGESRRPHDDANIDRNATAQRAKRI